MSDMTNDVNVDIDVETPWGDIHIHYDDDDENAAEKLFPEVLLRHPVVEDEYAAVAVGGYCAGCLGECHPEGINHFIYYKQKCKKHAEGLEGVRQHERADSPTACIEPDECDEDDDRHRERDTVRIEYELLENHADHIEADGGTRHLGQQEEACPCLVAPPSQTATQVGVDGSQPQPVIDRKKQECHGEITEYEAQAGLHIGHVTRHHHARDTDEGDPRDARSDHAECHQIPRRPAVCTEESFVVGLVAGGSAD